MLKIYALFFITIWWNVSIDASNYNAIGYPATLEKLDEDSSSIDGNNKIKKQAGHSQPVVYKKSLRKAFNPAWMDYCDPYHCNDYWREVCGLNRKKMKFRYFQSICHLILNNQCANYRGSLKYDLVELRHCRVYTKFLRTYCPRDCEGESVEPVCALKTSSGQPVLFVNQCSLDIVNCRNNTLHAYEEVNMRMCEYFLQQQIQN